MPEDVPVTDMPEDSSPTSHDQDFVSFVRSTLSALNTKMDNLLTNQAAFESKLESIERRVTTNTSVTTELSRATEFNSNIIKDQQLVIDTLQKSLAALSQDNVDLFSSLSSLNARISRSERHSRSFNVRFLGVPEQDGENCVKLAEKLLLDKFHVGGSPIENAHRTGKAVQGHPRHVIARFYSRVTRMDVLRTARVKLSTTKIGSSTTSHRTTYVRRTAFAHLWTNCTSDNSDPHSEMANSMRMVRKWHQMSSMLSLTTVAPLCKRLFEFVKT